MIVLVSTNLALAGSKDLRNWRCPYTPDGACPPNRDGYGYYKPKWSRWPGVSDANYQSRLKPGQLSAPAGPKDVPPRESPEDLLLPPSTELDDSPPAPPSGDFGVPPLTPDSERVPDILAPPGQEAMDQLLPNEQTPPEAVPQKEDDLAPDLFPEANEKAPNEGAPREEKPFEGDPFKDDIFDDAPPAPPSETKGRGSNLRSQQDSSAMPAMHTIPSRTPSAQSRSAATPKSRLVPASDAHGRSAKAEPRRTSGRTAAAAPFNPLRSIPAFETEFADEGVIPTAAWEEAPAEPSATVRTNPLRQ
jgi:hypothetical protein